MIKHVRISTHPHQNYGLTTPGGGLNSTSTTTNPPYFGNINLAAESIDDAKLYIKTYNISTQKYDVLHNEHNAYKLTKGNSCDLFGTGAYIAATYSPITTDIVTVYSYENNIEGLCYHITLNATLANSSVVSYTISNVRQNKIQQHNVTSLLSMCGDNHVDRIDVDILLNMNPS